MTQLLKGQTATENSASDLLLYEELSEKLRLERFYASVAVVEIDFF